MTIVVLAMSPSGETVFTRDDNGRIWEHHRLVPGEPMLVNESIVDRVVADHGYERVDVAVSNWIEVDEVVQARIAQVELVDLPVNGVIARAMLDVADRWLASPKDRSRVLPLVLRLLEEDSVGSDADLRRALLERAEQAAQTAKPAWRNGVVSRRHQIVLDGFPQSFDEAA